MSSIVEFAIKLKDLMSGGLTTVAANAQKMAGKVNNSLRAAANGSKFLTHSIDELEAKLKEVNKVRFGTVLKSEFKEAGKEAQKLERQISRLKNGATGGIGGMVGSWRKEFVSALPGGGLLSNPLLLAGAGGKLAWDASQKAMQAGKEKMQLQVLAGDAKGAGLYDMLTRFATDTVFGTEVYGQAAQMLGAGMRAEEVMPMMKMLGDVSMGNADKLGGLSYGMSQVMGAGVLRGQEKIQLENAGFYPLQQIMKKTGETFSEVTRRMENGKITFTEVKDALAAATGPGGQFYGMLNKIANTPAGQLEQLKGTIEQFAVRIGNVFLPIVSKMMEGVNWIAQKAGPLLEPAVVVLGAVATGIMAVAAAQWAWNAALATSPVGWFLIAIGALAAGVVYLWQKFEGFRAFMRGMGNSLKEIGQLILDVVLAPIQLFVRSILNGFKAIWYAINGEWAAAADAAKESLLEITGVNTVKRIYEDGKKIGEAFSKGYQDSLLADRTENIKAVINAGGDVVDLAKAFQELGEKCGLQFRDSLLGQFEKGINIMLNIMRQMYGKDSKMVKWAERIKEKYTGVGAITNSHILEDVEVKASRRHGGAGLAPTPTAYNKSNDITGSGVRSIVFNIDTLGVKGGLTVHAQNVTEGISDIKEIVVEQLNRALDGVGGAIAR